MKRHKNPAKQTIDPANESDTAPVQLRHGSQAWAAQAQATHGNAYVQMMAKKQLQAKGQTEGQSRRWQLQGCSGGVPM